MKINPASTRLAFYLIAAISFLILLSAIIPQKDITEEQIFNVKEILGSGYIIIEMLKLDEIYTSPYFFTLLGLLAINLISANIKRFRIVYKTEKTLIKTRHLGSIIFHFSLILIIIGVILNYFYKFDGIFGMTEKQTIKDDETGYFRIFNGPLYTDDYDNFNITLDSIDLNFRVAENQTEAAHVSLFDNKTKIQLDTIIRTGQSFEWNDMEFHLGQKFGYSPELILQDTLGNEIFRGFIRLATNKTESGEIYKDFILINQTGLKFNIEVIPENDPGDLILMKVTVERNLAILYEDTVTVNQKASFDKYEFFVPHMRKWCYIEVVRSPYLNLIFFGFWTALAGMSLGLIGRTWGR